MYKKLLVALAVVGILTLAGCGDGPQPTYPDLDPALSGDYVANFAEDEAEEIFASDGWANSDDPAFNAVWKKENLSYSDGQMHLSIKDEEATTTVIDKETGEEKEVTYPHTAGEARTHHLYGYGDFMVKMKPTNVPGSVSTFFTFTYSGDKIDGVENKWDEIDIEFLGKDTTKVQFNYFVGGKGGHEYNYRLGFDASKEFHEYGFRWEEDRISWVIDGKTVHVVTGTRDTLPSCPGRILTSYWPCHPNSSGWGGYFAGATDDTVDYEWIKSSATGIYADGEEPVPPFDEDVDWDKIDPVDTSFENGWGTDYKIEKESEYITNVTYESVDGWNHIISKDAARYAKHADTVKVTLKNNSSTDVAARVDVKGEKDVPTGEESHTDILNLRAYSNEVDVTTNLEWGGSSFTLPGNEEVTVVMNYDNASEDIGAPTALLFLLDSLQDERTEHPGSSVTIKDIKFANLDGTPVEPDPKPEPPTPEPGDSVKLVFDTENDYTLDPKGVATESVNVTYTDMVGDSYQNFYAPLTEAEGKNQISLKIKNNGEATSKVRVDVEGTTQVGNTKAINTSASAEGHAEVRTDLEWGGSFIDVAAAEEVTFVVSFDQTTEKGAATLVKFFVDSSTYQDSNKHSGDVTFSNFELLPKGEPQPGEYEKLVFNTENDYTLDPNGVATESVTASYVDMVGDSYHNFSAPLSEVEGKTQVSLKIKNNGESASKVRVDVEGTTSVGNHKVINASATAAGHDDVWTDLEWGGTYIMVSASEEVTLVVTFDQTTERGAATLLKIFIDSCTYQDSNKYTGSVTFSCFELLPKAEPQPAEPVELTFNTENSYVLDPKGAATKTLNVAYENIGGSSYENFGAGLSNVEGKTTFAVTMKNNGEAAVKARVDVKGTTQVGNTNTINTSAYATGHTEIYTDTDWGGSSIELAAGEEVEFVITFDQTTGRGAATYVMFFLDSFMGTETTHSGNVTLSNFVLA